MKVYPNPTKGLVNVEAEGLIMVSVYNTMGQRVSQNKAMGNRAVLDLQNTVPGLYLLRIQTEKGTFSRQIAVEPY